MVSGAGLLLEEKSKNSGVVFVKTIIPGGAAQEDGRIKLQDQVTHVDSTAVKGLSLEQVRFHSFPPPPVDSDFVLASFDQK